MKYIIRFLTILLILVGLTLTGINLFGLTQNIRPENMNHQDYRFKDDLKMTYEQAIHSLKKQPQESQSDFNKRITDVIADSLAHIHWNEEEDNTVYNQLVPIWENYFLYFVGQFTDMPEFQKYHFADYKRSLKRGIGICGDASMIMSQVLNQQGTTNQIVSFPGHVVVAAQNGLGSEFTYDADFGVLVPHTIEEIQAAPWLIESFYQEKGFSEREIATLRRAYAQDYQRWDGVSHFITKKYYFERITYWLKWPLPALFLLIGLTIIRRQSKSTTL
ncbi:hypothetical protein [Paraglaciecola sp. 25GB23A]|uniref:hypothetical protein n=1 Tax=Paraglaciecola sp. 25GB23A TaxID=3156068 RepID=UPI0032AF584B